MHALAAGEVQSKSSRPEVNLKVRTLAKCGGKRIDEEIDLEHPPEDYVEKLVAVLREVWRVLADDGTRG